MRNDNSTYTTLPTLNDIELDLLEYVVYSATNNRFSINNIDGAWCLFDYEELSEIRNPKEVADIILSNYVYDYYKRCYKSDKNYNGNLFLLKRIIERLELVIR